MAIEVVHSARWEATCIQDYVSTSWYTCFSQIPLNIAKNIFPNLFIQHNVLNPAMLKNIKFENQKKTRWLKNKMLLPF